MFNLSKFIKYVADNLVKYVPFAALLILVFCSVILLAILWDVRPEPLPLLLAVVLVGAVLAAAWQAAARFVRALYGLKTTQQAGDFLGYRLFGRSGFSPYLIIKEGKIMFGEDVVKKIGGPGGLVIYRDTAVVLEQAGRLTRVIRGPAFPNLEPFEKVWDVLDLRPQRWVFTVSAITRDGIPIDYDTDVRFQLESNDEAIFKAATTKWIRDASRSEEDRLMIWTKRVIIGETEGVMRAILARHELNQLLDPAYRKAVCAELHKNLGNWAPGLGVKILSVELGDVKLRGQVVQQWIETWRAEREREMSKTLADGKAQRARALEQARVEVRRKMLDDTAEVFARLASDGQKVSSRLVTLSFIEMLKHTPIEQSIYSGTMIETLNLLQRRIQAGSLSAPSASTRSTGS